MKIVRDDVGVGREAEKLFAPYRHAVEKQWEIELGAHHNEPALDLVFKIDTRTHGIFVDYRPEMQGFRPSKAAGEFLNQKQNRDAIWVWMIVPNNDRLLFVLTK